MYCFIDTLLVVESVGVHIESKRGFGISTSTEFLPWDTVEDIFINEVIKGVSLYVCLHLYHSRNEILNNNYTTK